ncbi:MAG: ABC transporter permease, partial [Clostridiaceae bacterium]|nr:ABC transporter permease [Clostridiaceae bacterium]
MGFVAVLRLKAADLFARRLLLVALLVIPVALGMVAGSANRINADPAIQVALVDEDRTPASARLAERLGSAGWTLESTDLAEAERGLGRGILDGVLVIRSGYEEGLPDLRRPRVDYLQASGSLVTSIVQETVAAAVLPEFTRASLSQRLADLYDRLGQPVPEGLQERFDTTQRLYAETIAKFEVVYHSQIDATPTITLVVSDYSMEVFFLSVYAVAGTIALSAGELRKRLAATAHGLALDYAATLSVLYLLGVVQILCYTGAMRLLMGSPFVPAHVGTLAVYLLLMLGFGQLTVLLDAGHRLYFSLLVLLVMGIAGGVFFQLPEKILTG